VGLRVLTRALFFNKAIGEIAVQKYVAPSSGSYFRPARLEANVDDLLVQAILDCTDRWSMIGVVQSEAVHT
jgi:hypothetical protein